MSSGRGNVQIKLSLSERVYSCSNCGLRINRDVNAAIKISHIATRSGGNLPREFGDIEIKRRSHLRTSSDTARARHVNTFSKGYNAIFFRRVFPIVFLCSD